MSEKENNLEARKSIAFKPSSVSLGLALGAVFLSLLSGSFYAGATAAIIGLAFGIIGLYQSKKNKKKAFNVTPSIYGIVINLFLILFLTLLAVASFHSHKRTRELARRVVCGANLKELGKVMHRYANDNNQNYPLVNNWCDLLQEHQETHYKMFNCPTVKDRRCSYAINPNVEPSSPNDVVLLFETKGGWNQFGGPEILTTENHSGEGCWILFNDGHAKFLKTEQLEELKWDVEEDINVSNARRPANDEELKYWLENMVWYHRLTNEEIRAATGLTENKIAGALKKFNIRPDNRPKRAADAPLLVLPYPGGRHPRIGFLDGAIEPQRETKFSVFTPWEPSSYSYVVVDVPEAIWSNLGLTYLAHTHIDTIWTKQGIDLPKLEWNRRADGTLDIERKLPNGTAFGMQVKPTKEVVRMELWLKNGTDQKLSDLRVQNCVMTKMAVGFEQQTNENKVLTNPYVACRSSDGKRWIITAWENCNNPWANDKCPCFHSDPKFPDLEPGKTYRLHGWLSFYEGTNIKAEFERIESTSWRDK